MPSPFPGMNPYMERQLPWDSFHPHFISTGLVHLAAQLRPRYVVRIESRMYIHEPAADRRFFGTSDIGVQRPPGREVERSSTATVAPAYVRLGEPVEIERVKHLTIRARDGGDLVTVLELLSRTNKYAGPDRAQYEFKRTEVLKSRTHFVEVDLLRGGPRMVPDDAPPGDYCAVVSRVEERPEAGVWSWHLRDPMPVVPIPLRGEDADAKLDLKAILDQMYDGGSYADDIYTGPPEPRLTPEEAAWAAQFVPPGTPTS